MRQPDVFRQFAQSLHQDVGLEVASVDELARLMLSGLDSGQRRALRGYIDHLRGSLTSAEIKGVLKRASFEVRFSAKGAADLLRATAEQLEADET